MNSENRFQSRYQNLTYVYQLFNVAYFWQCWEKQSHAIPLIPPFIKGDKGMNRMIHAKGKNRMVHPKGGFMLINQIL